MGWMSTGEVATFLGRSPAYVRRLLDRGAIPGAYRTPGGHWNVPHHGVEEFLAACQPRKRIKRDATRQQ